MATTATALNRGRAVATATAIAASYTGHEACAVRHRGSAARTGTRFESHARVWKGPSCSRGRRTGDRGWAGGASGYWGRVAADRRAPVRSSEVATTVCWRSGPRLCM